MTTGWKKRRGGGGGLKQRGSCQNSKRKGGPLHKTDRKRSESQMGWFGDRTGRQISESFSQWKAQVSKGRQDEPRNLSCISKAVSWSLKRSRDVLASDECGIDKLLKHGSLSWSAASRVELQWEVFQATSVSLSECDDSEKTFGFLTCMFVPASNTYDSLLTL